MTVLHSAPATALLVDRVLPKQVVVLSVYIKSSVGMSSPGKPFIKSEDANGKSYSDRSRVPPSLGPSVMFLSFFFAMLITFLYMVSSGASILYPYYSLRYSSLLSHGFTPASFSDNYLISKAGFKSKSPITVNKPYAEGGRIVLPLVIKNITSSKIRLTIVHDLNSEDYKRDKEKANAGFLNLRESVLARNSIDEKYGYSSKDELFFQNLILEPGEERNIMIRHTVLPTTTLKNFNFFVDIKNGDYDYDGFRDNYDFDVEKFNGLSVVQELLRSLQR